MVADRRVEFDAKAGTTEAHVLEFGVSGFLLNGVMVMYDLEDKALWSQLLADAISGPHVGTRLRTYPVDVTTWAEFKASHPEGRAMAFDDTGFTRPYADRSYAALVQQDELMWIDVEDLDDRLPPKTLGMGVKAGDRAVFVPRSAVENGPVTIETDLGPVVVAATDAGMRTVRAPEEALVAQSFYYGWSAFHPETEIYSPE